MLSVLVVNAQDKKESKEERQQRYIEEGNPFKDFGYKPRIATLSKGKYKEFFTDSIVQIGSFTFNRVTGQITGIFITENLGNSEADLKPDLVSRWFSPDPLSQEFPEWSPYTFTNDNPIFFTDPTGLAAESVLDDYGVDANGNFVLLNKTEDNFDRLYAIDNNGNKVDTNGDGNTNTEDSVVVNDQTILPELEAVKESSTNSYHGETNLRTAVRGEGSQTDLFKIFNFSANNTNVEFSLSRFNVDGENQFALGTFGNRTLSPGDSSFGFESSQFVAGVHSHPNIPTSLTEELGSMYGDRGNSYSEIRRNGQAQGLKYVYFPNSNNLYNINNKNAGAEFIRNTNGNYKRFFFGTLNSK